MFHPDLAAQIARQRVCQLRDEARARTAGKPVSTVPPTEERTRRRQHHWITFLRTQHATAG